MFRIDGVTAASALPGVEAASAEGFFTEGNPGTGIPATLVRASWLNRVQETLRNVCTAVGLTPTKTDYAILSKALSRWYGGGVRTVTAHYTLTADDAGLVYLNPVAGNITVTLPPVLAAGGKSQLFTVARYDTVGTVGNVVTLRAAGTDSIEGFTSIQLAVGERLLLRSNAAGTWMYPSGRFVQALSSTGYQRNPGNLIEQWGRVTIPAATGATVTFPIAFPTALLGITATVVGSLSSETPVVLSVSTTGAVLDFNNSAVANDVFWRAWGS